MSELRPKFGYQWEEGIGRWFRVAADRSVEIVCAEPELANDAYLSLKAGHRMPACPPLTIADGLRSSLGERTFEILSKAKVTIALVSETQILDAMRMIWEHMKIVVEPSSAVTLAAVLNSPDLVKKRLGVILSGGNTDFPNGC